MPQIPDKHLNINQRAQISFAKLKQQMKLDLAMPIIQNEVKLQSHKEIILDRDKIEAVINGNYKAYPEIEKYTDKISEENTKELTEIRDSINNIFEWIDSLELDPKLSLAIGMIISYKNTRNKDELRKAIEALMQEGKFERIEN